MDDLERALGEKRSERGWVGKRRAGSMETGRVKGIVNEDGIQALKYANFRMGTPYIMKKKTQYNVTNKFDFNQFISRTNSGGCLNLLNRKLKTKSIDIKTFLGKKIFVASNKCSIYTHKKPEPRISVTKTVSSRPGNESTKSLSSLIHENFNCKSRKQVYMNKKGILKSAYRKIKNKYSTKMKRNKKPDFSFLPVKQKMWKQWREESAESQKSSINDISPIQSKYETEKEKIKSPSVQVLDKNFSEVIFEEKPAYPEKLEKELPEEQKEDGTQKNTKFEAPLKNVRNRKTQCIRSYSQPRISKNNERFLERQELLSSKRETLATPKTDLVKQFHSTFRKQAPLRDYKSVHQHFRAMTDLEIQRKDYMVAQRLFPQEFTIYNTQSLRISTLARTHKENLHVKLPSSRRKIL
ncbi:unnamed protein product [Moneuplotes crassus]|uniref:Uncharacterized protein n=1 Tax=Euplotes crassus TaxID=5936 RepID=A0AAD1XBQ7_EUPCR|nr:unnamed protein product [Moneuplotes crassus]